MMIWEMGERWVIAWTTAGLLVLTSCNGILPDASIPLATIADLETTLSTQDTTPLETAAIAGEVIAQAPLVNAGLYRIDDGTGTLWIRTETLPLPAVGDHLRVEFTPQYRPITIEGQSFDQAFGLEQKRTPVEE